MPRETLLCEPDVASFFAQELVQLHQPIIFTFHIDDPPQRCRGQRGVIHQNRHADAVGLHAGKILGVTIELLASDLKRELPGRMKTYKPTTIASFQ